VAGFPSESVAEFRRNGWPTCVGISGRDGSEYASMCTGPLNFWAFCTHTCYFVERPLLSSITINGF
jgi:hypothetical protein